MHFLNFILFLTPIRNSQLFVNGHFGADINDLLKTSNSNFNSAIGCDNIY